MRVARKRARTVADGTSQSTLPCGLGLGATNSVHKILLISMVSLALLGNGCSKAKNSRTEQAGGDSELAPPTLAEIMRDYHTAASQHLTSMEADFNQDLPSGVSPLVYLDYDVIATWFGMRRGPATVDRAISDYLEARTGHSYDAPALSRLAAAMNSLDAEGIVLPGDTAGSCVVVPEYPGISFDSFYAASFRVGPDDLLAGRTCTFGMSTQEFQDFANAHESWHCFDIRYIRDSGDGLAGAVKQNRTEMFADLGGVMEGIRHGAGLSLIDKAAALRATWAFLTGPAHARLPEEDGKHFLSIVYATQDGLYALKARIGKIGIEKLRHLRREQLRTIAYVIADEHCIAYTQAQALQAYYATGKVAAAVAPLVARLKAIAASSVRGATPAELASNGKGEGGAAIDAGLTGRVLLEKLKRRAGELGSATSFPNQLKARQEFTDALREKLLRDPSSERLTESQLKLLFYTDPQLTPRNASR